MKSALRPVYAQVVAIEMRSIGDTSVFLRRARHTVITVLHLVHEPALTHAQSHVQKHAGAHTGQRGVHVAMVAGL